jgi:regulator of sigma E protease
VRGVRATVSLTLGIVQGYARTILNIIEGKPSGVQPSGPIGIVKLIDQAARTGINQFLWIIALISIYVAIFNVLPIPALDGGKMLFLAIEAIKKKPVSPKIEQGITTAFFILLIVIMIFVTVKFDIPAKF